MIFSDDALTAVADEAYKMRTGARGLKSIMVSVCYKKWNSEAFALHLIMIGIELQSDFSYPNTLGPRGVRMTEMFG